MVQKKMMNDKTKLVKEANNDKASRCCWSAYQKRLGKMGLGEMGLSEMLPNPYTHKTQNPIPDPDANFRLGLALVTLSDLKTEGSTFK